MFKRSLLISTVALCASLSFTPAQAAPSAATVSGLASCSADCVAQAQSISAEISAMPKGPAKDELLLALIQSVGALAIANTDLSVALSSVAAEAKAGLSTDAAASLPFVDMVVAALKAGRPGDITSSVDDAGPGAAPGAGPGEDDGLGNSSAS